MPEGVSVVVVDGMATIDFVDPARRGPALQKLVEVGGPNVAQKLTHVGPRDRYQVTEHDAREAGLLDKASRVDELESAVIDSATEATGATPPEAPSIRELHAQTVRSGIYGAEFEQTDTTFVNSPTEPSAAPTTAEASAPVEAEVVSQGYDDGKPDMDWSRAAIDKYAADLTPPLDVSGEKNKELALKAITAELKKRSKK